MDFPIDRIIGIESGGDPNAKNPRSSATGLGQFIESTWLNTIARHRPDLITGRSKDEILGMRTDPALSKEMTAALASDNAGILTGAGLQTSPGSVYLAHFAGPQGAIKVMRADPTAPVETILGAGAVSANPFLKGMSAGDLQAWAARKMGVAPMQTASRPTQPTQPMPPQPQPAQQFQPTLATQPPSTQQAPAQQGQPMDAMLGLPRRPPDMARLMALLQQTRPQAPGFSFARGV